MDHTRLGDRLWPHGLDRLRQTLEPVADHQAHVADAAVLDLGQHPQPAVLVRLSRAWANAGMTRWGDLVVIMLPSSARRAGGFPGRCLLM